MKHIIIGDIHGQLDKLEALLTDFDFADRFVVFVGDYINRGPDSKGVIDRLIDLQKRLPSGCRFLRGNHEEMLLGWMNGKPRDPFLRAGGLSTIRSYTNDRSPGVLRRFIADFPSDHRHFLNSTTLFYETPDVLVSHAGFDPSNPLLRDVSTLVFGHRRVKLTAEALRVVTGANRRAIVYGHYVQESGEPLVDDPLYCIDTGCGTLTEGRLTAMLLPERLMIQY